MASNFGPEFSIIARSINILHYWGGCPKAPNSKWRRFLHLLRRCSKQGWQTYLVWTEMPKEPELWKPFTEFGCKILVTRRPSRNFDRRCVYDTYRMLRNVRCDVFHCHNVHTSPLIAATLAGVPVRIWSKLAMSPYYEQGTTPQGLHRLQASTRVSGALAHRVLCISGAVRDELRCQGVAEAKLLVIPGAVDVNAYATTSADGVRSELDVVESDLLISAVGHAVPVKGWDTLIRAFDRVSKALPRARLLLIGSSDAVMEREFAGCLRSLVRDFALEDRVRFLGQRSDVARILASSDVFVMPSRSEGFPAAVLEALAVGLPCVAARVGGIPELIVHRRHGLLFDREDVEGLADTLIELLRDSNLRQRLRINGRKRVQQFDLDATTDRMLDRYEKLLANTKLTNGNLQKRLGV